MLKLIRLMKKLITVCVKIRSAKVEDTVTANHLSKQKIDRDAKVAKDALDTANKVLAEELKELRTYQ